MARKKYPENPAHPRYWLTWLAIASLQLAAWLPWPAKYWLGRQLGRLGLLVAKSRRHITEVNIRLCFPEKSPAEQKQLVKEIFLANGIGLLETATAFTRGAADLKPRIQLEGQENLEKHLAQGKGVLLLGIHSSTLDLGGAMFGLFYTMDTIYKPHKNPVFNRFIMRGRTRYMEEQIANKDLKTLVRRLRQDKVVWYSPDQDFGRDASVFAPFFGVEAASLTMTARLIKMAKVPLVPACSVREKDGSYTLKFLPELTGFPSGDDLADATRVNAAIEALISPNPEQYLWLHRRFKTRPNPDDPSVY